MNCRACHLLWLIVLAFPAILGVRDTEAQTRNAPPTASSWTISGTVRDTQGTPVQGASVHLANENGTLPQQTTTDGSGKFSLKVDGAGFYQVTVSKPPFNECVKTAAVGVGKDESALNIVLSRSPAIANGKPQPDMQLSDSTDFTVAGITDWTAAGGHGSDINLRTSEALARETRNLESRASSEASVHSGVTNSQELSRRRDQLKEMLLKDDRADLHRELGDVDEQLNDPLSAEREYERATQLHPSEQNYFSWAAELLLHRAIQPAVEVFTKGTHAYPLSERMLAGLGAALYASGLYPQAAERLCAATDLKPADPTPYLFLGKMVEAYSLPLPCSKEKLARFSTEHPKNAAAHYYYAVTLWKGRADSAQAGVAGQVESLLMRSVALDPEFARAYLQLAILYSELGELAKASDACQKSIAADPNLPEAHFRLGQIYKKIGESSKATQEFQAYEQIQKAEAATIEKQRREIQQFVIVFKDQPQVPADPKP